MSSQQMIDWNLAVTVGLRLVRPGPQVSLDHARQAVRELRELAVVAERHVLDFTGLTPVTSANGPSGGAPLPGVAVVDRPGWIRANVDGFRVVLEPLVENLRRRADGGGGALLTSVGSRITGAQVGAVLAYLAGRVLGQYELFLPPDPEGVAPTGRLTLVAPNIVMVERELDAEPHDFRLWVCLHEETHRVQFTAVPWLRGYVQEQMTEFLLAADLEPGQLLDRLRAAADAVADAVRGGDANLIEAVQTPRQKEILDRLTAVMTLVEGHGDYVMDAVGPGVVPSVAEIRARFQRRRGGGNRFEQTLRRVLGIDLKMKQYAQGGQFVRTVIDEVGIDGFNRVWTSPEALPTLDEITDPARWVARVARPAPAVPPAGTPPAEIPPAGTPPTGTTPTGPSSGPPPGPAGTG